MRIFSQRIATGEFEPDANDVSYRQLGLEHFNTTEARALALDTAVCTLSLARAISRDLSRALRVEREFFLSVSLCCEQRQSMVLIKNIGDALPIELELLGHTETSRLNMVVAGNTR